VRVDALNQLEVASFEGTPGNLAGDKHLRGTAGGHRGEKENQDEKKTKNVSRTCASSAGTRWCGRRGMRKCGGAGIDDLYRRLWRGKNDRVIDWEHPPDDPQV
jgi:hypothetical protein